MLEDNRNQSWQALLLQKLQDQFVADSITMMMVLLVKHRRIGIVAAPAADCRCIPRGSAAGGGISQWLRSVGRSRTTSCFRILVVMIPQERLKHHYNYNVAPKVASVTKVAKVDLHQVQPQQWMVSSH